MMLTANILIAVVIALLSMFNHAQPNNAAGQACVQMIVQSVLRCDGTAAIKQYWKQRLLRIPAIVTTDSGRS